MKQTKNWSVFFGLQRALWRSPTPPTNSARTCLPCIRRGSCQLGWTKRTACDRLFSSLVSPWYDLRGWLGVKQQWSIYLSRWCNMKIAIIAAKTESSIEFTTFLSQLKKVNNLRRERTTENRDNCIFSTTIIYGNHFIWLIIVFFFFFYSLLPCCVTFHLRQPSITPFAACEYDTVWMKGCEDALYFTSQLWRKTSRGTSSCLINETKPNKLVKPYTSLQSQVQGQVQMAYRCSKCSAYCLLSCPEHEHRAKSMSTIIWHP